MRFIGLRICQSHFDAFVLRFSRHPGFIWYSIVNALVSIYYWNYGITILLIGLTLCNFILVVVEDRILFPKMFAEYGEYRKRTPFIL